MTGGFAPGVEPGVLAAGSPEESVTGGTRGVTGAGPAIVPVSAAEPSGVEAGDTPVPARGAATGVDDVVVGGRDRRHHGRGRYRWCDRTGRDDEVGHALGHRHGTAGQSIGTPNWKVGGWRFGDHARLHPARRRPRNDDIRMGRLAQ